MVFWGIATLAAGSTLVPEPATVTSKTLRKNRIQYGNSNTTTCSSLAVSWVIIPDSNQHQYLHGKVIGVWHDVQHIDVPSCKLCETFRPNIAVAAMS